MKQPRGFSESSPPDLITASYCSSALLQLTSSTHEGLGLNTFQIKGASQLGGLLGPTAKSLQLLLHSRQLLL